MRLALTSCAALVLLSSAVAARAISADQANSYKGSNVTMEGVAHVHPARRQAGTDIELAGPSGRSHLIGFVATGDASKFPDLSIYDGKMLDITGVVQDDIGQAEIPITSPRQIAIVPPSGTN